MKFGNVVIRRKVPCTMRDGITLYSDIYLPDETGEYPVLLMRQPYGRSIASTVTHAHPVWYASKGYIVVIQDVRGGVSRKANLIRLFKKQRTDLIPSNGQPICPARPGT